MELRQMKESDLDEESLERIVSILKEGGLVCLPCGGRYRIFADLKNEDAVLRLFQSKRRVHKAPSLAFIGSIRRLHEVADDVDPVALKLLKDLWPAALTIRFPASSKLPRVVIKELTRANGKIGVRIPDDKLVHRVAQAFGGPLFVSSANRGRRGGDTSPAQIKKNFARELDFFLDIGDITPQASSTVIDVEDGDIKIVREGAISEEFIREAAAS